MCMGEPGQDARVANPIRNQGSTDQNCFCPCPPHFSPHGVQPHSRHSTFSPVSVTISNGPYINLPVKVWGPSSLAMVSFILWLAVTFCTNQEGKEKKPTKRKEKRLQRWTASQGNAKYNRTNWSMGFSVPFLPSTPPTALSFRKECDLWQR